MVAQEAFLKNHFKLQTALKTTVYFLNRIIICLWCVLTILPQVYSLIFAYIQEGQKPFDTKEMQFLIAYKARVLFFFGLCNIHSTY